MHTASISFAATNQFFLNKHTKIETVSFILEREWDYFISLTFNTPTNYHKAHSACSRFIKKLNNRVFGKRSNKSVCVLPVLEEHRYEGYHCHFLVKDPKGRSATRTDTDFRNEVKRAWEEATPYTGNIDASCPDGKSWFETIDNIEDVAHYLTKTISRGIHDGVQWDLYSDDGRRLKHI